MTHRTDVGGSSRSKKAASGATNTTARVATTIAETSAHRHGGSDPVRRTSRIRPIPNRVTVVAVRDSVSPTPSVARAARYTTSAPVAAIAPAGSEKRTTRCRNPARARRGSGASARKNPGMPTLRTRTRVRWRGRNGKSTPIAAITSEMSTE